MNPILIVEDEPDGRELVSRLLKVAGMPLDVAGDGETAWGMLQQNAYSAVVIDLALPGIDGIELLRHIRNDAAIGGIPCVAITAYHTPELKQQAIGEGFNMYFSKPLDRTMFIEAFHALLS